jgi:N-acetylglucosaminyl-diphospho-decaprenol L-rhamnosyltransferase
MPPLSVVVPTHDTAELTAACVASVLARLPAGGELIVVDDASTDGTAELLAARFPAVHVERSQVNRGFSASANRGAALAGGDILLLLNSDTRVLDGALEALLAAFAAEPRLGVAGAQLVYPDGRPQWSAGPVPTLLWMTVMASGAATVLRRLDRRPAAAPGGAAVEVGWVTGAALAVRRAAWDEVGPLDEGVLFYAQDLDLCVRARAAGWRVALVPAARIEHHHGATIAAGEPLAHRPEALWPDLVRWGRRWHGERWARRARRAMRAAVAARIALRRVGTLFVAGERRPRARRTTAALLRGYAALASER